MKIYPILVFIFANSFLNAIIIDISPIESESYFQSDHLRGIAVSDDGTIHLGYAYNLPPASGTQMRGKIFRIDSNGNRIGDMDITSNNVHGTTSLRISNNDLYLETYDYVGQYSAPSGVTHFDINGNQYSHVDFGNSLTRIVGFSESNNEIIVRNDSYLRVGSLGEDGNGLFHMSNDAFSSNGHNRINSASNGSLTITAGSKGTNDYMESWNPDLSKNWSVLLQNPIHHLALVDDYIIIKTSSTLFSVLDLFTGDLLGNVNISDLTNSLVSQYRTNDSMVGHDNDLYFTSSQGIVKVSSSDVNDALAIVPEPSTYALILGAVALGFTIRRRK